MDILALIVFLFGSGIIIGIIKLIFDLGGFNTRFKTLEEKFDILTKSINPLKDCVQKLNHAVLEVQVYLQERAQIEFKHQIDIISQATSPIVLKDEFRPSIKESGIADQIEKAKLKLIKWLNSQAPPTGIDAQDKIINLVISGEINKYLDLTKYKQYMYKHGKTSGSAYAILAVYLFEVLIPELTFKSHS